MCKAVWETKLKIICRKAFENCDKLKLVEIPMDSEIHTIQRYAFAFSSIESINITSKLVNLEKFWCNDTPKLTTFRVSPDNPMYLSYDDKFIIGKTLTFKEIEDLIVKNNFNLIDGIDKKINLIHSHFS